jgi:hypothetical protein
MFPKLIKRIGKKIKITVMCKIKILTGLAFLAVITLSVKVSAQVVANGSYTFQYSGEIVNWQVPEGVTEIKIEGWGAQGGSVFGNMTYIGGRGAYMSGKFDVTPGQTLRILVGEQGGDQTVSILKPLIAAGGGGGSFVATSANVPLLVAGGGGGRRNSGTASYLNNTSGTVNSNGQLTNDDGQFPFFVAAGGTNGNGGFSSEPNGLGSGGPGGGFYTNGGPSGVRGGTPGFAFVNGGLAAPTCTLLSLTGLSTNGGFGGGGAGGFCSRGTPGGGGGYSGGGSGLNHSGGGGGGSYNSGINQSNATGVNTGNGKIVISIVGTTYYADADSDGYGNLSISTVAVSQPSGYVTTAGDCDDTRANVNSAAAEICDGLDNDCDGQVDEDVTLTLYADNDGDGIGSGEITIQSCTIPSGFVTLSGDCNDNDASVYPGAPEMCDGSDHNCDGIILSPPVVITNVIETSCPNTSDGGLLISTVGGMPPFMYMLNNGAYASVTPYFTGLPAGLYLLHVADSSACSTVMNVLINAKPDTISPVMICTDSIVVSSDAGQCGAVVVYDAPSISDNCDNNPMITQVAGLSSGSFFPIGITVNKFVVSDTSGNQSACSFTVTVEDNEDPKIINLPADIIVNNVAGKCSALVSWAAPQVSDNCDSVSLQVQSNVPNGGEFPVGTTTVTYVATDASGNTSTGSFNVKVKNTAPVLSNILVPNFPVSLSSSVSVSMKHNDNNLTSTKINWGDGAMTNALISGQNVSGTHVYKTSGIYTITFTATDACGVSSSYTHLQSIVIFDPSGLVAGAGWFNSPKGSATQKPAASGKAHFTFASAYIKGIVRPLGISLFQFQAGNITFASINVEWLMVSGNKAIYKGAGCVNGINGYNFIISAIDGGRNVDKVRVKIWNLSGLVIYDSQIGASDYADPTTAIGSGAIVVLGLKSKSIFGREATEGEESFEEITGVETSAYPNPFENKIIVNFASESTEDVRINLTNVHGQSIFDQNYKSNKEGIYEIDLTYSALSQEIYLLRVNQGYNMKILKLRRK